MEAFDSEPDNVKVEKARAMNRFRRLRNITKLFRLLEVCFGLIFLSWTSTRLPFAVRISGEYFRLLVSIIVTPLFIFLLCNVIVFTLLLNSGQFSAQSPSNYNAETHLCDEFLRNAENGIDLEPESSHPVPEPEETIYQDKQIICEVTTAIGSNSSSNAIPEAKSIQRNQRKELEQEGSEEQHCLSEAEKVQNVPGPGQNPAEIGFLVEELSNEEFQRTIEAFIAKQVKFHQEEKFAIVVHSHA